MNEKRQSGISEPKIILKHTKEKADRGK